ncbi:hypothetical protein Dimus_003236 [Dionaea muscipula]
MLGVLPCMAYCHDFVSSSLSSLAFMISPVHFGFLSSVLAPSSCPTTVACMACCGTQSWEDGAEIGIFSTYGISPRTAIHGYARPLVGRWELVLGCCAQPMSMLGHGRYPAWRWILGRRPELGELWGIFGHEIGAAPISAMAGARRPKGVMSSPSREWSWEPRVPIHPSLLEMTPLRIPSPAPDSPEYSSQGSEESSFSGDESCPAREFGEDNALCVSGRGVNPYTSEEGVTSRGLVGVPPSYPLAARLEGRSPKKLKIKLKSRSLGESSQSRPETTALCVVDVADTPGPLPSRGEVVPSEPSNNESPLKSSMRLAGCKALLPGVKHDPSNPKKSGKSNHVNMVLKRLVS